MRTRNIIIELIIFLCVVGCVPKQAENEGKLVLINRYGLDDKLSTTDTIYLYKEIKNETVNFIGYTKILMGIFFIILIIRKMRIGV